MTKKDYEELPEEAEELEEISSGAGGSVAGASGPFPGLTIKRKKSKRSHKAN